MADHTFCRTLLKVTIEDVRKVVPKEVIKEAWTYNYKDGRQEFQIPSVGMYWYGQACCSWYARVQGWEAYMERIKAKATA